MIVLEEQQDRPATTRSEIRDRVMSTHVSDAANICGFIGALLVDSESGLVLVAKGDSTIDLPVVTAFGIQIVEVMLQHLGARGLNERVEEVLVTLGQQIHLIRPIAMAPGVLFHVCLDKKATRLGMARVQVKRIEEGLVV